VARINPGVLPVFPGSIRKEASIEEGVSIQSRPGRRRAGCGLAEALSCLLFAG